MRDTYQQKYAGIGHAPFHRRIVQKTRLVKPTSSFLPLLFLYIGFWNLQMQQFRNQMKGLALGTLFDR